jgi:uncharacterized protein YbjT (DUF2867 family)
VFRNPAKAKEWQAKGAEIAIAELQDPIALEAAFRGAEGVFIMTPPLLDAADPMAEHNKMLTALSIALNKTQPQKIVFLSSIGAHLPTGTGAIKKLYDMEQSFRQLRLPTASIRAAWFMENFSYNLGYVRQSGQLPSFLDRTNAAIPMVAAEDIGHLAAVLLQETFTGHRTIQLEGPCCYSADDVASILSYEFEKDISSQPIPPVLYEATYQSSGCTPAAARMMAEMNRGFNSGHIRFEEKGQEHHKGDILLEDVLKRYISH